MKNKEKIERCLEELTEEAFKANKTTGVETLQISEKLNLRRNVVSHYLNVLVSENKVIKIKSRPVQFISKKILDKYRREKSYEIKEGSIDEVIYENITSLYNILIEYDENNLSIEEFRKKISLAINICLSNILYKENSINNDILERQYLNIISKTLEIDHDNYGLKYYGNTAKIFTKIILFFMKHKCLDSIWADEEKSRLEEILNRKLLKEYIMVNKIVLNVKSIMGYDIDFNTRLLIMLYSLITFKNNNININALIIAHGYSTASSIGSIVNQYFDEFIFDTIDIPIDISKEEITIKVKEYLSSVDNEEETIILVDMKSLLYIADDLKDVIKGDLIVINNITTNFAINIAKIMLEGKRIYKGIIDYIENNERYNYRFIKGEKKRKAILTTCVSGIGTAVKIKDLLSSCIRNTDIDVIPYAYGNLASKGIDDEIFSKYDVKLVISTTELKIDGVNCILLENIISSSSNKRFEKILLEFLDKNDIKVIKKDIVKMFSLKNIINQLNILDPNKIINEVDIIISKMENGLKTAFPLDLRMLLYIHISIMIERLILNQELVFEEDDSDYIKNNKKIIKIIDDSFENISKEYNLNLTSKEIKLIQEIIESRLGKLKK